MPIQHEARKHSLDDIGDKSAPPGTRDWASYIRLQIQGERHDIDREIQQLKSWLEMFTKYEGWRQLTARDGSPFLSFEDFCQHPEPEGAGLPSAIAEAVLREEDTSRTLRQIAMMANADPARDFPGQGARTDLAEPRANGTKLKRGTNQAAYLAARIKRDRPDIAERVEAGEFSSMRSAALEAGIVKPRLQVPADLEAMAAYLRRRFTPAECSRLAALLVDGE